MPCCLCLKGEDYLLSKFATTACVCDEAKGGLDNSPYKLLLIPTCFILTAMSGLNSDESDLTALSVG